MLYIVTTNADNEHYIEHYDEGFSGQIRFAHYLRFAARLVDALRAQVNERERGYVSLMEDDGSVLIDGNVNLANALRDVFAGQRDDSALLP